MIIDDDIDSLQIFKDILQYGGFETYDFSDPKVALEVFKEDPNLYDLILTDIQMEVMDSTFMWPLLVSYFVLEFFSRGQW